MQGRKFTEEQYKSLQKRLMQWSLANPNHTPKEYHLAMNRLLELHNYGVTSRDLALGKQIEYVPDPDNPGKFLKYEADVRGGFITNVPGDVGPLPSCEFSRTKWRKSGTGSMTEREFVKDAVVTKTERDQEIKLTQETTSRDPGAGSDALLESSVGSTYGAAVGVINPVFMNMMLELAVTKPLMNNFVNVTPMPDMTFYYPIKTSRIDQHAQVSATAKATKEGSAGTDIDLSWTSYEVAGWKWVRHFELTNEVMEMLSKFINVQGSYVEDLARAHALLWDWSVTHGILQMVGLGLNAVEANRGTWRYWDDSLAGGAGDWNVGAAGTNPIEIPFGAASVKEANARKSMVYMDLAGGAKDGSILLPNTAQDKEAFFAVGANGSTIRPGSGNDDVIDLFAVLGTLQTEKKSKLEYVVCFDAMTIERVVRDSRFRDTTLISGTSRFQGEPGYMGKIALGGSSDYVDLWRADSELVHSDHRKSGDTVQLTNLGVVIGGRYGGSYNLGQFTPYAMRIDDGFQVVSSVLRHNYTKVASSETKGSTWPGDYHDVSVAYISYDADVGTI